MNSRRVVVGVCVLTLCLVVVGAALRVRWLSSTRDSFVARPPQFVAFTFDGSRSVSMWQESRSFAKRMSGTGTPVRFTYFVSGVYFLASEKRDWYVRPDGARGDSAIGFGGSHGEIRQRAEQVDAAAAEGHEIASHGNGHHNGINWTRDQWAIELKQFDELFGGPPRSGRVSGTHPVFGFRAPYMAAGGSLLAALESAGYHYDASGIKELDAWPARKGGLWQLAVPILRFGKVSTGIVAMDYAFYEAQSGARDDLGRGSEFEQQMTRIYRASFAHNYLGGRAPLQFVQHFELFNGGAYWRALQRVAMDVCALPEVRCVSDRELIDYLDAATDEQLQAYREGRFARSTHTLQW